MSENNNTPSIDSRLEIGMVADSVELSQDVVAGEPDNQSRYNARLEAYVSLFESRLDNDKDRSLMSEFISYLALKAQNNSQAVMSETLKAATVQQIGVIRQFRSFVKRRVQTSRASATENLDDKIDALIASKKLIDVSLLTDNSLTVAVTKLEARGYSKNEDCNWWEPPSVLTPLESSTTGDAPAEFEELTGEMEDDAQTLLTKFNEKFKDLNQPHKNLYETNLDTVLNSEIPKSVEFSDEMTNAEVSKQFSGAVQNYNFFTSQAQEYQSNMSNVFSEVNFMMQGLNAFITKHQSGAWNYLTSYFKSLEESCPVYRGVKEKLEAKVRMFFYSNRLASIPYGENEFSADSSFLRARKAQIQEKAKKHKEYYNAMLEAYKARIKTKNQEFATQVSSYEAQQGQFNDVLSQKKREATQALTDLDTRKTDTLKRVDDQNSVPALKAIGTELGITIPTQASTPEAIKTFLKTRIENKFATEKQELDSRKGQLDNDQRKFALSHELLNDEIRSGNKKLKIMENEYEQMFDMKDDIFGSSEEESRIGQIAEGITSLSRSIEGITRNDSDHDDIELKLQHPNWLSAICSTRIAFIPGLTLGNIITAAGQTIKVAVNTIAGATRLLGELVLKVGSLILPYEWTMCDPYKAMFQTNYSMELMNLGLSMAKMSVHDMMEMLPSWPSWLRNETLANTLVAITRWGAIAPTIVGGLLTAVQDGNSLAHALGDIVNLQTLFTRGSAQTLGDAVGYTSEVADNTDSWGEATGSIGAGLGYLALNFTGAGTAGNGGRLAAIGARMSSAARGAGLRASGARFALGVARGFGRFGKGMKAVNEVVNMPTLAAGRGALKVPGVASRFGGWAIQEGRTAFIRKPAEAVAWGARKVGNAYNGARNFALDTNTFLNTSTGYTGRVFRWSRNLIFRNRFTKNLNFINRMQKSMNKLQGKIEDEIAAGRYELAEVFNQRYIRIQQKLLREKNKLQALDRRIDATMDDLYQRGDRRGTEYLHGSDELRFQELLEYSAEVNRSIRSLDRAFEETTRSFTKNRDSISTARASQSVAVESSAPAVAGQVDEGASAVGLSDDAISFVDDIDEVLMSFDDLSDPRLNISNLANESRLTIRLIEEADLWKIFKSFDETLQIADDVIQYNLLVEAGVENVIRSIREIPTLSTRNTMYVRLESMLESIEYHFLNTSAEYMGRMVNSNVSRHLNNLRANIRANNSLILESVGVKVGTADDAFTVINYNNGTVYQSNANPSIIFKLDSELYVYKATLQEGTVIGFELLRDGSNQPVVVGPRLRNLRSNLEEMLNPQRLNPEALSPVVTAEHNPIIRAETSKVSSTTSSARSSAQGTILVENFDTVADELSATTRVADETTVAATVLDDTPPPVPIMSAEEVLRIDELFDELKLQPLAEASESLTQATAFLGSTEVSPAAAQSSLKAVARSLGDIGGKLIEPIKSLSMLGLNTTICFSLVILKNTYNLADEVVYSLFKNSISQLPPSLLGTLELQLANEDSRRRIGDLISNAVAQGKTISEINNLLVSELEVLKQTQKHFYSLESGNDNLSTYFNANKDRLFKFNGKSVLDELAGDNVSDFNRFRTQARQILFVSNPSIINNFKQSMPETIDVYELILIRAAIILKDLGSNPQKSAMLKDKIKEFVGIVRRYASGSVLASNDNVYQFVIKDYQTSASTRSNDKRGIKQIQSNSNSRKKKSRRKTKTGRSKRKRGDDL
ncbi:hypothetical protein HOJ01_00300 [bacterium]|jgi:hypothetical protein|nr:hypothetical protein [bacterium]